MCLKLPDVDQRGGPIAIAGATGSLGRRLTAELEGADRPVRALVRDGARAAAMDPRPSEVFVCDLTDPRADLAGACRGARTVISVAGQSTDTRRLPDRRGFHEVDYGGNLRLVEAAEAAGAERFLYVSVFDAARLRGLEYVDAHERVVERLRSSALDATVVRANGFFSAYRELLELAAAGRRIPLFAGGSARSNPIHEADLAVACLDALDGPEVEVEVGGPEILTRRREVELAFAALGRKPRTAPVRPWAARAAAGALRPFDRRRAASIAFVAAVSAIDMVAPSHGIRRLADYLAEHAGSVRTP
jgi:uncharacterized protein YbjT (DUF2867 family)